MYIGVATMENRMEVPQQIKNRTPVPTMAQQLGEKKELQNDPAILLLGIYPRK